ncbi:MAG: RnfABCDGE type electron transport complex subunit D [Oscillospiraceae bacterium]|jgi:electron transport complex protein RnfD|nr:RnfABCDGE type electron transport complex subunit D [Oscillospiraceae bacterium]
MNNKELLLVSPSPHISSGAATSGIMLDVIIALLPAAAAAGLIFGYQALILMLVCVGSCVVFEFISRIVMKRKQTIGDLSAVVTGLLLAFNLPATLNPVYAVIGSAVAIIVVKQMFGGIGHNFANPAITARVVLMLSFPVAMTTWVKPFFYQVSGSSIDAQTTATPLGIIKEGTGEALPSLWDMFIGTRGGSLGETCAAALLLGGLYLVIRRVISPIIPLCFIGTVALFSWIFGQEPIFSVLSGGVLLGAIFMATDYTTSPITRQGKVIFAILCGLITVLIRTFAALPEGVSFSILFMNILVPLIERIGRGKKQKKGEKKA